MGQTNVKEGTTCTPEAKGETLPNTDVVHTCDKKRSPKGAIHPSPPSSVEFGSKDAVPNQIPKPKALCINGRSRSYSRRPSLGLSGSRHASTPVVSNVPSTLREVETEFHRVLSVPVRSPVLQRPDVIRHKSSSVGSINRSSTDLNKASSLVRSQLSYCTTSFDTPYGNNNKICEARDETFRIVDLDAARHDCDSRDDQIIEMEWSPDQRREQIENPLRNSHRDGADESGMNSDSVVTQIKKSGNAIGETDEVGNEEESFSSFFKKKKKSRFKRWLESIRRKIGAIGLCRSHRDNEGVRIQRSSGHLT